VLTLALKLGLLILVYLQSVIMLEELKKTSSSSMARQLKLWKHLSLEAYCATLNFHQHRFSIPVVSYKEKEVPE